MTLPSLGAQVVIDMLMSAKHIVGRRERLLQVPTHRKGLRVSPPASLPKCIVVSWHQLTRSEPLRWRVRQSRPARLPRVPFPPG